MFATLTGTDTGATGHLVVFDRLHGIATARGFVAPDTPLRVQPDGPIADWSLEQKGPLGGGADFLLAVTAPRVPGISPIFPVFKTVSGPLFGVVVLNSVFVVSREDRRDVSEFKDITAVAMSFEEFLGALARPR